MAENTPEPTAGLVVTGMLGGYVTGRVTKQRPLAGVVLAAAGIAAGRRRWNMPCCSNIRRARQSAGTRTALLSAIYVGAFGASHPLAKKIGAWPAVLTSTAAAAGAARVLNDTK